MKLLHRQLVLGWSAILLVGLTDYANGSRLLANSECAGTTESDSALGDSGLGTQTSASESGSTGDSTKSATGLTESGTGSTNSSTEPSGSNGESTEADKESTESGIGSTEFGLSTEDPDSTSSDNSNSMTTEPVEVTTPEEVLDKREILEQIQEKLSEILKLLEMLKSLFAISTTTSGGLSTTVASEITTEVPTGVPVTEGSDVTAETSTGVPTMVASEGTTETSTGVPTTVALEGTTVTSTGVPTTVASEITTVDSTGVSITVTSEGKIEASTVISSEEKSKSLRAEETADICNPTANEACTKLRDVIVSVETFTTSFEPTREVSMNDLTEITQTTSNLNDAVTMVMKDPSGVNPDALNTRLASVEQSIVSVETKIKNEIEVLDDPGTNNTLAIVLGTLGALLGVAIVATLVIRCVKKKKACKKTMNEAA